MSSLVLEVQSCLSSHCILHALISCSALSSLVPTPVNELLDNLKIGETIFRCVIVFLYFFYSTGHKSPESIEKRSHLHFILVCDIVTLTLGSVSLTISRLVHILTYIQINTFQHTIDNRITSVHWFNVYRMGQKKEIMRISFYFSQEFFF